MVIPLSPFDLSLAALLILILCLLSWHLKLKIERQLAIATLRTTVQLLLIGQVLTILFKGDRPVLVALMSLVMLLVAGREVMARQQMPIKGIQGWLLGTGAMFISSFSVTFFALTVIIGNTPWYQPQYAIPLLGMLLGNTMNGVAVSIDRLTATIWQQRQIIEQRLMLGQSASEAISEIRTQSIHAGMIPIINSMAAAGIVSLPGMMTGQILGGSAPMDAVKYQILIMFLIASGTGFGVLIGIWIAGKKFFDDRERLHLDILDNIPQ